MSKSKSRLKSFVDSLRMKASRTLWQGPASVKELVEAARNARVNRLIKPEVHDIIERVISVSGLKVRDVMIPRAKMVTISLESNMDEILETVTSSGHSRFPVLNEPSGNEAHGILLAKDILAQRNYHPNEEFNLRDTARRVKYVPESKGLNALLKDFRESRSHMAIVVNEYNGIAGLVTIEDVLEQIVGEIEDESDVDRSDMITTITDNEFSVNAEAEIDEFNEHVSVNIDDDVDTIGGFIVKLAGRIPNVGETFESNGLEFEVANADQRRILLLRVTREVAPESTLSG